MGSPIVSLSTQPVPPPGSVQPANGTNFPPTVRRGARSNLDTQTHSNTKCDIDVFAFCDR